jgi:hypothetical protein
MQARKTLSIHRLALLFCVEAVIIEALVNLTFKLSFGQFIFYYYPSDLWHLTSLQTLPFYLLGGYVIAYSIKMFSAHSRYFAAMSAALACTLVFLA